jgi:hypothetical protein
VDAEIDANVKHVEQMLRQVNLLTADAPCHGRSLCREILEGFFWGVSRLLPIRNPSVDSKTHQKLQKLLEQSTDTNQKPDQLQRIVMEISAIAPPNDPYSVEALSKLLTHSNKYVRTNACKSLARIGGERAKEMIQQSLDTTIPEVKQASVEALAFCTTSLLVEELYRNESQALRIFGELEGSGASSNPNEINCEAFRREEESLMRTHLGQYAAYHVGMRVAIGSDEEQVYAAARKRVPCGLIMLQRIEKVEERPTARLRSPRVRK